MSIRIKFSARALKDDCHFSLAIDMVDRLMQARIDRPRSESAALEFSCTVRGASWPSLLECILVGYKSSVNILAEHPTEAHADGSRASGRMLRISVDMFAFLRASWGYQPLRLSDGR